MSANLSLDSVPFWVSTSGIASPAVPTPCPSLCRVLRTTWAVRLVIVAAVPLTAVLFTSRAADPVNVIKLTALTLSAVTALALWSARSIVLRQVPLPWGASTAAAVVLAVAFCVAAAVAPDTTTATVGTAGRNSGLIAYGAALLLFLLVTATFKRRETTLIGLATAGAGVFTATYAALQLLGVDRVRWNNPFNPAIAALGNPNFAAGFLAICLPTAVLGALWVGWSTACRVVSGAAALLILVVAVLTESAQGPLAAAAGLFVLGIAVALDRPRAQRRVAIGGLGAAALVGAGALVVGVLGAGPLAGAFGDSGGQARPYYWSAARSMFQQEPVLGVGLDSYGYYWRAARPLEVVTAIPGEFSDAAHSVPLQHLAQGGLLLAAAYLLFVGVVAWALVTGLRRLSGQDRLLLGGLGGAWAAYQVQSLVSIDQVPLLTAHYVLAGAVVVAARGTQVRLVRLPGAPVAVQPTSGGKGRKARAPQRPPARTPTTTDAALLATVGVVTLGLMWLALLPLRASMAAREGDAALARGDGLGAVAHYARAGDLLPGAGIYDYKQGVAYNAGGLEAEALERFLTAIEQDPRDVASVRTAARLADFRGDLELARRLYARGLQLDPLNSEAILDLAVFDLKHERAAEARDLLAESVVLLPEDAALWARYGDALAVTGDTDAARRAYDRALTLEPGQTTAAEGLAKLTTTEG